MEDQMIKRAVDKFLERGRVRSGQLRRVSHKLQFVEGNLLFEGRIVTPKHLRLEAMDATMQHHLGQAEPSRNNKEKLISATNETGSPGILPRVYRLPES